MSGELRDWALPAASVALILLASSPASAFCRSNSCDPARGDACSVDSNGCRTGGNLLFWDAPSLPFYVQADGSPKNHIAAAAFEKVLTNAFRTWSSASCSPGKHPNFKAVESGLVTSNVVEYLAGQTNANIFMFRDDAWLATIPGSALALTTVSYDWHTGQIFDADVEVNGTGGNITNGKPTDGADLPSVMTHEIGHFLGLDHSPKQTATMNISYKIGAGNLRALDSDDVAGICTIYPPAVASSPAAATTVEVATSPLAGCSLAAERSGQSPRVGWLLLALGFVRRARRARPASRP